MAGFRKLARRSALGGAISLAAAVAFLGYLQLTGNVHAVVPGQFYRSAQPGPSDIAAYQKQFGIRTIINLRTAAPSRPWYRDEIEAAQRLGIRHIDFPMSASRQISQDEAARLVAIFRDAPKPILVHCISGSDRSGLVSALYAYAVAGQDEETAESQISWRYGHLSIPGLGVFAMDLNFEALEPWLGIKGS